MGYPYKSCRASYNNITMHYACMYVLFCRFGHEKVKFLLKVYAYMQEVISIIRQL